MFLEKSLNAASYFYSDHGSEKLGFTDHWCLFHRFQRSVKGAIVFFLLFQELSKVLGKFNLTFRYEKLQIHQIFQS